MTYRNYEICFFCYPGRHGAFFGCKNFEAKPEISLPLRNPDSFSIDTGKSDIIEDWWLFFDTDELNAIIKDAKAHNFDLKILKARLEEQ
ncbi:MAG: hypothetical protein PF503_11535 [Desulfobacula sp.]|nr:hypothetical protein [Desulfobacula sp.]